MGSAEKDITGLIFAGGRGSRMRGTDKGLGNFGADAKLTQFDVGANIRLAPARRSYS